MTKVELSSNAAWRSFVMGTSSFFRQWSFIFAKASMTMLVIGHLTLVFVASCAPAPSNPDEPAVRAHLERYFATWSAQDMEGYGACFHPQARITFVQGTQANSEGLTDFLHGQRLTHHSAPSPMKELPLSMNIVVGKGVAQAEVRWELHKQSGNRTGTDYFTLAKTPEGWRIVALVWEQD